MARTGMVTQLSVSVKSEAFEPEIWMLENVTEAVPRLFNTMTCAALDCPVAVEGKVRTPGLAPSVGA